MESVSRVQRYLGKMVKKIKRFLCCGNCLFNFFWFSQGSAGYCAGSTQPVEGKLCILTKHISAAPALLGCRQMFVCKFRGMKERKISAQMMLHCAWNDAPAPQGALESGGGDPTSLSTTVREFLPSSAGQDINLGLTEMLQREEQRLRWKLKRNGVLVRVREHEWVVTSHDPQSIVYSPGKGCSDQRSGSRP